MTFVDPDYVEKTYLECKMIGDILFVLQLKWGQNMFITIYI